MVNNTGEVLVVLNEVTFAELVVVTDPDRLNFRHC